MSRRFVFLLVALGTLATAASAAAQDAAAPFFNDGALQTVELRINSADWAKLRQNPQDNTYYPCDLVWQDQTIRNVGIRSRGRDTRSGSKPGLRVDFDRYSTQQTFLGLKAFVLDNLVQDPSGLRERLAMKLYRRLGLPAPRETHARLFVNNVYFGLYAIVESIDRTFLREYEGLDDDGFLFEYNWLDVWQFTYRGSELESYAALFSARTHENDAISTLYDPIEAFVRTANTSNNVVDGIEPFLNAPNFLRFLAAELFVAEHDGLTGYAGMNNFYLYRTPQQTEFQFIAWDKDNAFASVEQSVLQGVTDNVLTRRLLNHSEYRAHYLNMVLEAAASADAREGEATGGQLPPTWLQAEVSRQYAQIRDTMRNDPNKPFSNDEFESAVESLRVFARDCGAVVRDEVEQSQP